MKRIFFTSLIILSAGASVFAQSEVDALKLSRNDLIGTARSVGMGGAFGALGGDISGIAINPAGIGVYKSSEVVATIDFRSNNTKTTLNNGSTDKSKFQLNFDNLAFVGTFPINSDVVPLINVGASYNKIRNFNRKHGMKGVNMPTSLTDYMAERANFSYYPVAADNWDGDWLGILGYDGKLIEADADGKYGSILNKGETVNSNLLVEEKGDIASYDFNIGTTFSDLLSVGFTASMVDMNFHSYSSYGEKFTQNGGMQLDNNLKTKGTGYQVKLGAILKPIEQLRVGVAYHSSTWYEMTDYYVGDLFSSEKPTDKGWSYTPDDAYTDYKFKTPDKWVFSLAGVIGQIAIISADYEITNYKNSMSFRDNDIDDRNDAIKNNMKNASSLRVGAEVRFTPQFSGRVGYSWVENPYQKPVKDGNQGFGTAGTMPHFVIDGDTNYFTYGLGYRFSSGIYADIAFVMKSQKDDVYAFSKYFHTFKGDDEPTLLVDSQPGKLKNNMFSGILTVGYRF